MSEFANRTSGNIELCIKFLDKGIEYGFDLLKKEALSYQLFAILLYNYDFVSMKFEDFRILKQSEQFLTVMN